MKGIYLTIEDISDKSSGVSLKINSQINIMKEFGLEIDVVTATANEIANRVFRLFAVLPDLKCLGLGKKLKKIDIDKYDFIYIRKSILDKSLLNALKCCKNCNPDLKVYLEIPTYPYDSEMKSFFRKRDLIKEKKVRYYYAHYVDHVVTFSMDNEILGIPSLHIANGVDYSKFKIKTPKQKKTDEINLIAVALFDNWHGYDRILHGLKTYYENNGNVVVNIHFVGYGPAINEYEELAKDSYLKDHVFFYGKQYGEELDAIFDKADIALDAMGRHRSGVYFNSSLKGKEYCARGLPIVSGVKTELDLVEGYPYYLRVSADDSDININEIIDFYNSVYNQADESEVAEYIRRTTMKWFDMKNAFAPVVESILKRK